MKLRRSLKSKLRPRLSSFPDIRPRALRKKIHFFLHVGSELEEKYAISFSKTLFFSSWRFRARGINWKKKWVPKINFYTWRFRASVINQEQLAEINRILYRMQPFPRYRLIFKLPYLGMKLGHWPKCQKLHIYPLSTPGGRNWAYFCSTDSGFRDTGQVSKLPYLGMNLAIGQSSTSCTYTPLSTPKGRNWAYFAQRAVVYLTIYLCIH